MNSSFPNGDVALSDGGTAEFQDEANFLVLRDDRYIVGKGRTMLTVGKRHTEADVRHAWALWEAAQSPNATFEGLAELARRLTYTFEDRLRWLSDEEAGQMTLFAKMVSTHLRNMEGITRLTPFDSYGPGEGSRRAKGRFSWEGATGPLYVTLDLSPSNPDKFGYLDVSLDLAHTFFADRGLAHTSAHIPLVLNPGSKVNLLAEEAPFMLLEATKLRINGGVGKMLGDLSRLACDKRG